MIPHGVPGPRVREAAARETVTVLLCARNEAGGIARIVAEVWPHADEVLVVDGHSTDGTAALARAAGARVVLDRGRGKGDAYQAGIEAAGGDIVVFMDADGSHDAAEIPGLIAPLVNGTADLVVGSRHKGGSDEWHGDASTFLRHMGSGILSVAINRRWKTDLTDVLNGLRAARRDVLRRVELKADDFDIEQHMICQFLRHGLRVAEVRCHEYERKWGKSKLPTYRKAYLFFWRLFRDLTARRRIRT
jgi:dolichol-phosphate hexosyltransferase